MTGDEPDSAQRSILSVIIELGVKGDCAGAREQWGPEQGAGGRVGG
jgi:hypothetical protein